MDLRSERFIENIHFQIEDPIDGFFICLSDRLEDPKNLFPKLRSKTYHRAVAAFLECCDFDEHFNITSLPLLERVRKVYDGYHGTSPEVLHLKGDACVDMIGTQYADFNISTFELTFTHYTVRIDKMCSSRKGRGKIPVSAEGDLLVDNIIPY